MRNTCAFTTIRIFIYTLMLGIVAFFSHFAYELSGMNPIVGLFNPVNESVWEHLKFMFFPFLLWWIAIYKINNIKCKTTLNTWIVSASISLVAAPVSVVLLFYSYTGAFGIESVFVDMLLAFICYFIALSIASHFLKYSTPDKWATFIAVIIIVIIFFLFVVFTINPPELPIFYDNNN
ncbi:MAG: DUF6512 family protein [Eubacteriales bacterium]|nr:DUF6512 family protein [Eubacteriales bacterium]